MANVKVDDTSPTNSTAIQLSDVSLTFPKSSTPVIANLDLQINSGEFLAIIGPSGCGKTTLLRLLHGLLKPSSGQLLAGQEPITKPNRSRGFVFQSDCLMPWRRIIDNIGFPLELAGMKRKHARETASEMLDLIGLQDAADKFPPQLSGGMRQRINLARALAIAPSTLLMDEPFAALDAQTREILQAELLNIWARDRKTVIFVTHQLDEAVYLADRVVVLQPHPGRLRSIVPINIPRPRDLDIKRTADFADTVDQLWELIKSNVLSEKLV